MVWPSQVTEQGRRGPFVDVQVPFPHWQGPGRDRRAWTLGLPCHLRLVLEVNTKQAKGGKRQEQMCPLCVLWPPLPGAGGPRVPSPAEEFLGSVGWAGLTPR